MHTRTRLAALVIAGIATTTSLAYTMSVQAETPATENVRYVTDKLFIPLRSAQGDDAPIVNPGLPSGTALKVLEDNKASGYTQVEMRNGQQGWVRTRYLIAEPTAAIKLAAIDKNAGNKNDSELQKQVESLTEQNNKLTEQNTTLQKQLNEIRIASANVVKINEQNKELIEQNQTLQSKVNGQEALTEKTSQSNEAGEIFVGGLVAILTLLVSTWIDGIKRRRSYSSWG